MAEYIDRELYLKEINRVFPCADKDDRNIRRATELALANIPTADVAPVIHAHWFPVTTPNKNGIVEYSCSNCRSFASFTTNCEQAYCGNCGAKMDKE